MFHPQSCDDIYGQTFSHLWQKKTLQIESPLKRTRPSGCLDGAKYMKNSRDFFVFLHWKKFLFLSESITFSKPLTFSNKKRQLLAWRVWCMRVLPGGAVNQLKRKHCKISSSTHSNLQGRWNLIRRRLGTKTNFTIRPPTNDRTCMGWHTRHASTSSGLEGHLRPETLNLTAWNHA